jgi:uncharacterized protein YbjT (DUF2867 family)
MYLVIGATGNVGQEVVEQLLAGGHAVRVLTRDPARAVHWGGRVEVATGDLGKPDSVAAAAAGIEAAFVMTVNPGGEQLVRLVSAITAHGRPRIVFQSTVLADQSEFLIGRLHKAAEDAISASGLRAAFVRPGGFMSNAYQWIPTIKADGAVYNPMANGKFAGVAPEDIAAVAVAALTSPPAPGTIYRVTGGELLDVPQQVDILAGLLGRPIRCVEVPVSSAVDAMVANGLPRPVAEAVGESLAAIRAGRGAMVEDTVERVTGRPPMTFAAWASRHLARFR